MRSSFAESAESKDPGSAGAITNVSGSSDDARENTRLAARGERLESTLAPETYFTTMFINLPGT